MSLKPSELKKDFPVFKEHPDLVYLDNAATAQKPLQVINAVEKFYREKNSNIGRGLYDLAEEATLKYREARKTVSEFVNANTDEIVFVRNSTEALNLVADSLEFEGDIVLSEMAHHSEQLPFRRRAERDHREISYLPTENGKISVEKAEQIIGPETGLVSLSHVSNVFGKENPVRDIVELARQNDAYIVLDGAQSVPSQDVDVKQLDVDFMVFSGHKMLGPTGIGALYGRKQLLEDMDPYQVGGGMIRSVRKEEVRWEEPPKKFEAGTPNIAGAVGLAEAVNYLTDLGMEEVETHEDELAQKIENGLNSLEGVETVTENSKSLVSFTASFAHPHDIAEVLNQENIAVRAGSHCAQPQMEELDISGAVRVSPYIYNTEEDVEKLIESVKKVKEVFS